MAGIDEALKREKSPMYKIIGADGKEYGPMSADDLRRFITENRANAQTLAQVQGSQDWKPLASFPEFADMFSGKARAQSPPPFTAPPPPIDAEAMAAEILARDYNLEIGSCISRSWNLMTQNFWLVVGATFVIGLIQGVVGLLAGPCMGGLYFLFLKLIRGQRAEFGDAFAGFTLAFLQLFLAGLVSGLLTTFGLLLCILPGIYLAVAWIFTLPLVMDKRIDFWPAMELSRKVVSRHWWIFFGMILVNFLMFMLGFVACIIGIFIVQPVVFGAIAFAYEDIFCRQPAPRAAA